MKKLFKVGVLLLGLSIAVVASSEADAATNEMFRLYNPNSGEHFYTANTVERDKVKKAGWKYEGIGWNAPSSGDPVYRLYNPNAGDHHYTLHASEKNHLVKVGWKYEGIGWYSDKNKSIPLYRAYNPNAKAGSHNYTINKGEQNNLLKVGWRNEGIAWYGSNKSTTQPPITKYTVTVKHVGSDNKNLKSYTASVEKGKTYTAKAENFSGYTLKGSNSQSVAVNGNKTITFNYTKNSTQPVQNYTVTIKHIDRQSGQLLDSNKETVKSGTTYTAKAKDFKYNDDTVTTEKQFSYRVNGSTNQAVTMNGNKTLTFNYDQVHQIYIYATNKNSESLITNKNQRNVINVTHGKSQTITPPSINGYVLDPREGSQSSITLNNVTESKRIDFNYCREFNVTINHTNIDNNQVIFSESKKLLEGENFTTTWKKDLVTQNYYLCGENIRSGSRSVSNISKNETLNFKYKNVSLDQLNQMIISKELAILNQYRNQQGLDTVSGHVTVQKAADIRAEELKVAPGHYRPGGGTAQDLLESLGCFGFRGENIHGGFLYIDDLINNGVTSIMNAWKSSYTHNANLLDNKIVIAGFSNSFTVDENSGILDYDSVFLGSRNVFK
ncbi:MucBP domain-containing protein [Enterococcus sp. AZ196]|uniref:MucBP domain-containing protein n=1 Tax=Enterococcus sp. AZ196 TaxID=2774659 RepID=UPI003D28E78F